MSTVINCTICLEHLASDTFGCLSPCGHYFHQNCYNRWMAVCYNKPSYRESKVKCPQCNVESTGFIRSYLDLDNLCLNDDVSISDDDEEEEDTSDDVSDCDVCHEKKENEPEVPEVLRDDYDEEKEEEDVICINDDNDLNTLLQRATGDTVKSPVSRRVTLDGTVNADTEKPSSPKRKRKRQEQQSSTTTSTTASSTGNKSNDEMERIQKKYKFLKRKMTAMKKSLQNLQQENKQQQQLKTEHTTLKNQFQAIEKECQDQLYDNSKMKRELDTYKQTTNRLESENFNLKTRLSSIQKQNQSELKRHQEQLEKAKGTNMAEMKVIMDQRAKVQKENNDLLQEWQEQHHQLQELQKENAAMKRQLESQARKQFESSRKEKQQKKPLSKSKIIKDVMEARREMQRMEQLDREEERRLEQKRQEQKMKLGMSRQSNRMSKAATAKLSFLKKTKVKPSIVGNNVAQGGMNRIKSSSNAMFETVPKPKTAIKSHFVKKTTSKKGDLRGYFQK